jgi:hypothetical protein
VEPFPGAACCQPTELRIYKAAPLQALDNGSPHFSLRSLCSFAAIPSSRYSLLHRNHTRYIDQLCPNVQVF